MKTKFNATFLAKAKSIHNKSLYVKRDWVTNDDATMTLEEYTKYVNPIFKYIDGDPTIISKARKDGGFFRKMCIPLEGGSLAEYELSYMNTFKVGDIIDKDSLLFCEESFLDETHGYVTGDVIE